MDGEECSCSRGMCIFCMGTGRTAEFYYKGRPVPSFASDWKSFLLYGVLALVGGIGLGLVSWFAPDWVRGGDIDPLVLVVVLLPAGAAVVGWSLWLRHLWILEHEAWEAFYPEPEGGW